MSLAGQRLVITRARLAAEPLRLRLAALGAKPILFPTIEIAPVLADAPLVEAIGVISQYAWIVFSGPPAVEAFWSRLAALGLDERIFREQRFGVIGRATARALTRHGPLAEFVMDEHTPGAAPRRLEAVSGQWVLMLQAAERREPLALALARRGGDSLRRTPRRPKLRDARQD